MTIAVVIELNMLLFLHIFPVFIIPVNAALSYSHYLKWCLFLRGVFL